MNDAIFARAHDVEEIVVYRPQIRPGYVGWASVFQFGNGDLGIAFNEILRGENPDFHPPTLEYVEAVGIPYSMLNVCEPQANRDMISRYVHMKSTDDGRTWTQTGVCPARRRHYWYVGYPDGRIVRLYGATAYENPYEPKCQTIVEESRDGGNSWQRIATFLEDHYLNMFKFHRLSDGRLVAAVGIRQSWGPGQRVATRHLLAPGQLDPMEAAFFVSDEAGHHWSGPHYVLPGVVAWEFDFVELPGGNLLFINSTIQSGRPVRQIVRRTATGYVNEPLMAIHRGAPTSPEGWIRCDGIVPETVTVMGDGLLVGALRRKPYTCSKDLGENWYEIEGIDCSRYQPMCDVLPDGRVINVWHHGSDNTFGGYDMFIGVHIFRVDAARVPGPTRLELRREMSLCRDQYLNAFSVTLTCNGQPISGETVQLRVSPVWLPNRRANPVDVSQSDDVRTAVTDEMGVAGFRLTDKDEIPDIHAGYWVMPSFEPAAGSPYGPCAGAKYFSYPITPMRHRPGHLDAFMEGGDIVIPKRMAERFPDLEGVIAALDPRAPDVTTDAWAKLAGSPARARELLDLLEQSHLLRCGDDGVVRWYRWVVRSDMPVIGKVRVVDNEDIAIGPGSV